MDTCQGTKERTVVVVVLVPGRHEVVAVAAVHDAVVDELGNFKRRPNGRSGGGRLEKGRRQAGRLQDAGVNGLTSIEKLGRVRLSVPGGGAELVLQPQIGLVADLE